MILYTGDYCVATYYGGDNAKLEIAPDMSRASLTVKKTEFGPLSMTIVRGGPTTRTSPKLVGKERGR